MKYYTELQPNWLQWIVPDRFEDKELFRIITFYVFHCPSKDSSYMRKSLKEYGWNTPWRKPYKLNNQGGAVSQLLRFPQLSAGAGAGEDHPV